MSRPRASFPLRQTAGAALCLLLMTGAAFASHTRAGAQPAVAPKASAAPAALTPLAHVEVAGDGPIPVVLIPGLACDWTVFRAFMDRNKDRYTMYAVTLPGFGGSNPPPETPDPADGSWLANAEQAVIAMIQERKLDRPLVVGHSMGAHLAMRVAAAAPDQVRGAIAIDGMPAFPIAGPGQADTPEERRKLAAMMAEKMNDGPADQWAEGQKKWFASMVQDKARAAELAEMSVRPARSTTVRYLAELLAADATARVRAAKPPILIIAAITDESEPGIPRDQLRAAWITIQQAAPNVQIVYFENTRHFVMDDSPAELDLAVADFLAGKPVPGKVAPAK